MIRHHPAITLAAICLLACIAGPASAITIPSEYKSSSAPAAFHSAILAAVKAEATNLTNTKDPVKLKAARDGLIAEAEAHGGAPPAGPEYQAEYAADIAEAMKPLLAPQQPRRVRLNAAIVVGRVAHAVHQSGAADQFADIDKALLSDKDPSIVLWGMKTAKYVIGSLAQKNPAGVGALGKLVVNTVKQTSGDQGIACGPLVEEAYSALTLEPYQQQTDLPLTKMISAVLPDLLDLVQWRSEQYRNGTPPVSPAAELKVTSFLPVIGFPALNADTATRNRALKATGNMTCAMLQAIANGGAGNLIDIAREHGSAMAALGDQLQDTALTNAGAAIKGMGFNPAPDVLQKDCNALGDALKAMGVEINSHISADSSTASGDGTPSSSPTGADTSGK